MSKIHKHKKSINLSDELEKLNSDNTQQLKFEELNNSSNFENQLSKSDAEENFKDFLDLPNISGNFKGFAHSNKISAESIKNNVNSINLIDVDFDINQNFNHSKDDYSTLIVNKDQNNNVIGIDVICKCGNKTRINFDFDEVNKEFKINNPINLKIKDPEAEPISISENVKHHIYEAPTELNIDESYNESLLEELDKKIKEDNLD